jgi:hypothetical protein
MRERERERERGKCTWHLKPLFSESVVFSREKRVGGTEATTTKIVAGLHAGTGIGIGTKNSLATSGLGKKEGRKKYGWICCLAGKAPKRVGLVPNSAWVLPGQAARREMILL